MTSRIEGQGLVRAFAPAKINLFLHIGEKRADGYHELESIAVFADICDLLTFAPAPTLSLTVNGPFAAGLGGEGDNLVLRAARALAAEAGCSDGAAITLTKNLPVASGIGGGSADAAAALRGLVQLWNLEDFGPYKTKAIAETLGSDVPVCVESRASWMEGRGEIVTWAKGIAPLMLVLVNPGVAVSTAEVFRTLKTRTGIGKASRVPIDRDAWSLSSFVQSTTNDLEAPALAIAPVIADVLASLRAQKDVMIARMSGSGATCFALFETDEAAVAAADAIKAANPKWWVQAARILA